MVEGASESENMRIKQSQKPGKKENSLPADTGIVLETGN